MLSFPKDTKRTVSYSEVSAKNSDGLYSYIESITHYFDEEAKQEYITAQNNIIAAEQAHDSQATIANANEELDWIS